MNKFARRFAAGISPVFFAVLSMTGAQAHPSSDVAVSNWKFTPAVVTAHVGEVTTLRLTSTEGVHGIESKDLGIKQTVLAPNKTVEVTFTPAKAGEYKLPCSVVCGPGHDKMLLTIKVVPQ